MRRSLLILLSVSALLLGEQKLNLDIPDSTQSSSDTLYIEPKHPVRKDYSYRYQLVSGVAMMLFFGLMIGAAESLNPK